MEHRHTERYASDLSVLIYQHKLPIAIGRIRNGSRSGVFIETDFSDVECGHQVSLEISLNRSATHKLHRIELKALVVHKTEKGFGAELEINMQEHTDLLIKILRDIHEAPQKVQPFPMVASR